MKKLFLLLTISLFVGCENDEGKSEDEKTAEDIWQEIQGYSCLLYTSPSPRDLSTSRMPSSA